MDNEIEAENAIRELNGSSICGESSRLQLLLVLVLAAQAAARCCWRKR